MMEGVPPLKWKWPGKASCMDDSGQRPKDMSNKPFTHPEK